MRIFKNCIEMIKEVERDLHEMGIIVHPETMQDKDIKNDRAYDTKEIRGYSYCLNDFLGKDDILEFFNIPKMYCYQEIKERIWSEAVNPGNSWLFRKKVWEEFIHDGKFSYTYSERFHPYLKALKENLKKNPNTRQGILPIFDGVLDYKNIGGKARIPCSMYYQIFIREGKVHLIYTMRSCDFYTHFGADVWLAITFLQYMATQLQKPSGDFIHFMGSLHFYRKEKQGVF